LVLEVTGGGIKVEVKDRFGVNFDPFFRDAPTQGPAKRLYLSYDELAGGLVPDLFVTLVNPPEENPNNKTVKIGWELINDTRELTVEKLDQGV